MEGRETAIGLPPDLEAPSLRSGSLRSPSLRCGSSNSAVFNSIRLPLVVLMKVGIFLRPYSNCRWRRCLTDIGTEGNAQQGKPVYTFCRFRGQKGTSGLESSPWRGL